MVPGQGGKLQSRRWFGFGIGRGRREQRVRRGGRDEAEKVDVFGKGIVAEGTEEGDDLVAGGAADGVGESGERRG